MPSPMIYQDLTTTALPSHAAQYHSETEIVSVSAGGEKGAQQLGRWPAALSGWRRRWHHWAATGRPLRHPRTEQPSPPGDLFGCRLRRLGNAYRQSALSVDHLPYILKRRCRRSAVL